MTRPIREVLKTNIGKVRENRVDESHLELGLSRKQERRLTARVKVPVWSPGYVFGLKSFT